MKTRIRVHTVLIAVLTAGWLSTAQAMDEIAIAPNAYGQVDAMLICDKTSEGLKAVEITLIHSGDFHGNYVPPAANIQKGDSCLKAMVQLPRPYPELKDSINANGNGATTRAKKYIFRPVVSVDIKTDTPDAESFDLTGFGKFKVKHLVACGPGEEGEMVTVAVYSDGPSDPSYVGMPCGETLGMLASGGAKIGKQVTGSLGYDAAGNLRGGLTWVLTSADDIEAMECNTNISGELVVVYRENKDGVDLEAIGQSCLSTLSASQSEGRKLTSATPVSAGGGTDFDPDDWIWVIDSGTVEEGY
ncbi:MAG: hypothetical protein ABFS24_14125 [Pseudomonadota bacterium]